MILYISLMQTTEFNLVDVWNVLQQRWKFITGFTLLSLILATITLFLVPKYYKSTAVIVAANPALADKARLFNSNIEGLYSNFGSSDDLDRLFGMANLDTTYKLLVKEFGLIKYYKINGDNVALNYRKAVLNLKDDIDLSKTELNQLKIIVHTKDAELSSKVANRMVEIIHEMEKGIWKDSYQNSLNKLTAGVAELEHEVDSINRLMMVSIMTPQQSELVMNKRSALIEQVKEYYKSINEFRLAIANDPPALYTIERAYPSAKADKPKKVNVLFTVALASLVFACIIALIRNKKPTMHVA